MRAEVGYDWVFRCEMSRQTRGCIRVLLPFVKDQNTLLVKPKQQTKNPTKPKTTIPMINSIGTCLYLCIYTYVYIYMYIA